MDERAHDGERTASGTGCDTEPVLRSQESPAEIDTSEVRAEPAAPSNPAPPGDLMLPRAAGGGAGAVAALIVPAAAEPPDEPAPPPESDPQPAEPALATGTPPHEPEPPLIASSLPDGDLPAPADVMPESPPAAPAEAPPLPESPPLPVAPALAETQPPTEPDPPSVAVLPETSPDRFDPSEAGDAPAAEPALPQQTRERAQPTLVEQIPEVLPTPPKLPALSPSVAPVLRPLQLERARHLVPEEPTIAPLPPTPSPLPPEPPPPLEERPLPQESRSLPPTTDAVPTAPSNATDAVRVPGASSSTDVPLPLPPRARPTVSRSYLHLALRVALTLCVGIAGLLLALLLLYRWVDPPTSTLMLGQRLTGTGITQRWMPLERISPNLAAAVISSEDGHFCRHHGVDWGELKEAIESAGDGMARGGSTISMQVVKNLFLWPSRSYVRKAVEIPLAYAMEALWPKRRILEIYLNIAEWGPGIFGAEAAARYHFRKSALMLNPREAALLAVSLPNPFDRQAGRPGPGTLRLADNLLLRMRAAQPSTTCLRADRG